MKAGIWIDHEKAVIVETSDEGQSTRTIDSGVDKHVRLSGGARSPTPYGPQDVASEQKRDRKREHHLARYYEGVIAAVHGAEALYVFGPGEAKTELRVRIERAGALAPPLVAVEAEDKLTDRQIAAKVRRFFEERV